MVVEERVGVKGCEDTRQDRIEESPVGTSGQNEEYALESLKSCQMGYPAKLLDILIRWLRL